jgi:mono/diheme cytochrome c family protein
MTRGSSRFASSAGRRRRLLLLLLALALTGCARGCPSGRPPIHINPNMDDQPKYTAQSSSKFFYDGATMRPQVPGTVARGELHADTAFYTGKIEDGTLLAHNPREVTPELLARGAERFAIYCSPCHDPRGTGQGILQRRAGVSTTSLHDPRLLTVPDGHIFDVITNGLGLMPAYRWPITPADRWAIVAHVRRLQQER